MCVRERDKENGIGSVDECLAEEFVYCYIHTHPECVRVEGAWEATGPDWEEDRAARLQLGPIMEPWDWACCRGRVWGWCSGGWGCGC